MFTSNQPRVSLLEDCFSMFVFSHLLFSLSFFLRPFFAANKNNINIHIETHVMHKTDLIQTWTESACAAQWNVGWKRKECEEECRGRDFNGSIVRSKGRSGGENVEIERTTIDMALFTTFKLFLLLRYVYFTSLLISNPVCTPNVFTSRLDVCASCVLFLTVFFSFFFFCLFFFYFAFSMLLILFLFVFFVLCLCHFTAKRCQQQIQPFFVCHWIF